MSYSKYSGRGNFFSLPNEIFELGLNAGELSVYSFLRRCETPRTHQCWPSCKTIGQAVRMSENTVRKYLRRLEERGLIVTEPTEVITKTGEKRNGNLMFALRPIQEVIDEYYNRQLEELELATERQRVANLLREQESTACPPVSRWVARLREGQSPCPSRRLWPGFGPLSRRFGGMPIRGICRPLTALRGTKEKAGESPGAFVRRTVTSGPQCGRFPGPEADAFSAN